MSKLVGTKPYQTPRNADLGTMAYQNHDNVVIGDLHLKKEDARTKSLRFYTNETEYGAIGSYDDGFDIGNGTGGTLRFREGVNAIYPVTGVGGTNSNGSTSLGRNDSRFNTLWLTGGVTLSTTSDVLTEYDEGTFHPFGGNDSIANIYHATYVRIGNECHIHTNFSMKSGQSRNNITLPFTPENGSLGNNGTADATSNRYAGTVAYFTPSGGSAPISIDLFHQGNQGAAAYFIARSNTTSQAWPYSVSTSLGNVSVQFSYLINT